MAEKPTYDQLERKIKKLEKEAVEYMRKEREFSRERKLADYSHMKRTVSLMKINAELNREIKELKTADKEELEQVAHKLRGRIKALNCLYEMRTAPKTKSAIPFPQALTAHRFIFPIGHRNRT